ncbi:MAG: hypothetical protein WBM02_05430 [bacterium]
MTRFSGDRLLKMSNNTLSTRSSIKTHLFFMTHKLRDRLLYSIRRISRDRSLYITTQIAGNKYQFTEATHQKLIDKPPNDSGFSVVIVMVLLTVLTSLALAAGQIALDRRKQSAFYAERIQARHAALSGIDAGKFLLQIDQTPWDGPGDTWTQNLQFSLNTTHVSITIRDEQAAISLNHLLLPSGEQNTPLITTAASLLPEMPDLGDRWNRFLSKRHEALGFMPVTVDTLKHFIDIDAQERHIDLSNRNPHLEVLNREQLESLFTAFSSGHINLNTASPELLRALGGPSLEQAVTRQRNQAPLTSIFEIPGASNLLQGLTSVVDVKSSFFTIVVKATGSFVTCHAEAVIWRRNTDITVLRHKAWWS